jgi:hypothetical protein
LRRIGWTATEAVERTAAALMEALDGRALTKEELGVAIAALMEEELPAGQRPGWRERDGLGDNTYGESLARYALTVVALRGLFCLVPGPGKATAFARTDQWLGSAGAAARPGEAAARLVGRFLGCYGPATARQFGEWAGIAPEQARASWALAQEELVQVAPLGKKGWLHRRDLERWESPPMPAGTRLLPPHDPFLAQPERSLLVADPAAQRQVWRTIGNPGVALVEGEVVATWRPEKKGRRLVILVRPLMGLAAAARAAIEAEAEGVARARECQLERVVFS